MKKAPKSKMYRMLWIFISKFSMKSTKNNETKKEPKLPDQTAEKITNKVPSKALPL